AYVQELGVNAPGELVKKNQVLMKLYSPELLTTQRELIDLVRSREGTAKNTHSARGDFQRLIESAERRLRLWNVTDEQIKKIDKHGKRKNRCRSFRKLMASFKTFQ